MGPKIGASMARSPALVRLVDPHKIVSCSGEVFSRSYEPDGSTNDFVTRIDGAPRDPLYVSEMIDRS